MVETTLEKFQPGPTILLVEPPRMMRLPISIQIPPVSSHLHWHGNDNCMKPSDDAIKTRLSP
jgi:hypothetical protein